MGKRYTKEEDRWLKENWLDKSRSVKDVAKDFNKHFKTNHPYYSISTHCNDVLGLRRYEKISWNDEQNSWLKENWIDIDKSSEEIVKNFNSCFGTNRTYDSIRTHCLKIGLIRKNRFKWTKEMAQWLRDNYVYHSSIEKLKQKFEKEFNIEISYNSITAALKKFSICHGNPHPIGVPFFKNVNKMNNLVVRTETGRYITYANYIYEQKIGPIPKGYYAINLDGNLLNLEPDNLYLVTKRINSYMTKNRWYTNNRELTLAAIKYAELRCQLYPEKEPRARDCN